VDVTAAAVEAMGEAMGGAGRPQVLVSTSGIGWYGDRGDELLDERSAPGEGFLAELCRDWEAAALRAEERGARVAVLRFGVVLAAEGGALPKMLTPFRLGLGGPIGSGRQYMPWVHVDDVVGVIAAALFDTRYRGAMNVVAPEPTTSREFARALGRALGRPAVMPVPPLALRALLGEAATVLTDSQRALPRRLEELGHRFLHPRLDEALREIVAPDSTAHVDR
jgi:uncharacterized protein (TIGR01777 family)